MTEAAESGSTPDRTGFLGRVCSPTGEAVGTCFQVAPGVFVTAYHVLDSTTQVEPGASVQIEPLAGGDAFHARVLGFDRLHDLSVMGSDTSLPRTAPRLENTELIARRTAVTVTGYVNVPDTGGAYRYLTATGEWVGTVVRDDGVTVGRMISNSVLAGMGGAPVIRDSDGAVIGVVSDLYESSDGRLENTVWVARTEDLAPLLTDVPEVAASVSDSDTAESDEKSDLRPQRDRVEWLSDSPARADLLNRNPLARAVATRLRRFHEEEAGSSFLVHIDGPWGAGKSTLINLLRSELSADWLTVDFDAWRQSKIGPPWWALLAALRHDLRRLSMPRRIWLRLAEPIVRARRTGAPFALALLLLLALGIAGIVLLREAKLTSSAGLNLATALAGIITALGLLWAGALVAARFLLWDSARGARLFERSNTNPMQDIATHFSWLTKKAGRPVLFFIDDLDRCTEAYVVDFLEAVQTLMRDTPGRTKGPRTNKPSARPPNRLGQRGNTPSEPAVFSEATPKRQLSARQVAASFIIAADGAWIRKSYEVAFDTFKSAVDEPGRPLGYLFLDKLFQLRVTIPTIDPRRQKKYLSELLRKSGVDQATKLIAVEEQEVRDRLDRSSTDTEIEEVLRDASPDVLARVSPAAIDKLSAPEVVTATEHRLQRFAPLLAANPRSMKRFINDYSILRVVRILEGNLVQSQSLALWAILETQWPALADYLRERPEAVSQLTEITGEPNTVPAELVPLFHDPRVRRVAAFEYGGPLTPELIRSCCGAPDLNQADRPEVKQNKALL